MSKFWRIVYFIFLFFLLYFPSSFGCFPLENFKEKGESLGEHQNFERMGLNFLIFQVKVTVGTWK